MRGRRSDRYLVFLFTGLILGVVLVQLGQKSLLPGIFGTYFLSQYASLKIDTLRLMKYTGQLPAGPVPVCGMLRGYAHGSNGHECTGADSWNGDGNHAEYFYDSAGNKRNSDLCSRGTAPDIFLCSGIWLDSSVGHPWWEQ